jgi:hypothetical protein
MAPGLLLRHLPRRARSGVHVVQPQIAEGAQKGEHPFPILRADFLVERTLADCFGQEFRYVPASVVDRFALLDRPARERRISRHQRTPRNVDFHLHCYPKLTAIAKHRLVDGGNPARACVQIQSIVEGALLNGAVGKLDFRSAPYAPIAPARPLTRFQKGAIEARLAQRPGGHQPRDSLTKDNDFCSFAYFGRQLERGRRSHGFRKQAHGAHQYKRAEYPPARDARQMSSRLVIPADRIGTILSQTKLQAWEQRYQLISVTVLSDPLLKSRSTRCHTRR